MADFDTITVQTRDKSSKGAIRALRRSGQVPGIVYGEKKDPAMISIDERVLLKELQKGGFTSKLFELQLDDRRQNVLPRDIQLHPVTDRPIHVDFLRIAAGAELNIMVAVRFTDEEECDGLRQGGVLNIVRHEVELVCPATAIPEFIEVSLKGAGIGESLHISNVDLPDGVTPVITDRDFTIATIAAPSGGVEDEEAEGGEEEGEGEVAATEETAEGPQQES